MVYGRIVFRYHACILFVLKGSNARFIDHISSISPQLMPFSLTANVFIICVKFRYSHIFAKAITSPKSNARSIVISERLSTGSWLASFSINLSYLPRFFICLCFTLPFTLTPLTIAAYLCPFLLIFLGRPLWRLVYSRHNLYINVSILSIHN